MSGIKKKAIEVCDACPTDTYSDVKSQRLQCDVQAVCGKGRRIDAYTATQRATCSDCIADEDEGGLRQYMDEDEHRKVGCKQQPQCGQGQKLSGISVVKPEVCVECNENTFQDDSDHRMTSCDVQTTCPAGQKLQGKSKLKMEFCDACEECSFRVESNHHFDTCNPRTTCGKGERVSTIAKNESSTCTSCPALHFQSNDVWCVLNTQHLVLTACLLKQFVLSVYKVWPALCCVPVTLSPYRVHIRWRRSKITCARLRAVAVLQVRGPM